MGEDMPVDKKKAAMPWINMMDEHARTAGKKSETIFAVAITTEMTNLVAEELSETFRPKDLFES